MTYVYNISINQLHRHQISLLLYFQIVPQFGLYLGDSIQFLFSFRFGCFVFHLLFLLFFIKYLRNIHCWYNFWSKMLSILCAWFDFEWQVFFFCVKNIFNQNDKVVHSLYHTVHVFFFVRSKGIDQKGQTEIEKRNAIKITRSQWNKLMM